ncbi:hypothetical protein RHECNPAF_2530013 [Rhizobium etli CNPAF512]|nr:hypothetical protein RHECNPAF_2530013 [Rhizobium etli CNPAF512]
MTPRVRRNHLFGGTDRPYRPRIDQKIHAVSNKLFYSFDQ